ncbi:TRAM domain-containing protein [Natrarchaeobius halalkaliphilus]|uniref:TRAM domain-containing protein n=1 Tax=Natrarchaeobius halalkaliphilus TaxID=1679091 RepID=A0A3N6LHU8_9EURY|nr:TRAM domain-containing protein [Natrarchaeobius halalkaliphilus]RQG86794.1 TRAM domain-containing protein [Natrarchaeobius halalkaliphilus]
MEIPDDLLCVFSAEVTERGDSYVIEVPERELELGDVDDGAVYRVALVGTQSTAQPNDTAQPNTTTQRDRDGPDPPVEVGDDRTVDIEGTGEQGDGIARVERGYVIIVPETEKGERVVIEITDVKENVAFGEVVERKDYYL